MMRRKVIMMGDLAVGKTSLSRRFVHDLFDTTYKSTIGVDIYKYEVEISAGPMLFMIWDAEGNFIDDSLKASYARGASGAMIVGDATRPRTLEKMGVALRTFQTASPGRPAAFAFNKSDLVEPEDMAKLIAQAGEELGSNVIATSALRGENVREAFMKLGERMAELPDA